MVKKLAGALSLDPGAALEVSHFDRAPEDLRRALDRLRKEAVRQREIGERAAEEILPFSFWNLVPDSLAERLRFGSGGDLDPDLVQAIDRLAEAARTAPDLHALRAESRRILDGLSPVRRRKILEAAPLLLEDAGAPGGRRLVPAPGPGLPPAILPGDVLVVDASVAPAAGDVVLAGDPGKAVLRRFEPGSGPVAGVVVEVRRRMK